MTAELSRVAAFVTQTLTMPAQPAAEPTAEPAAKPTAGAASESKAKTATRPATKPATAPARERRSRSGTAPSTRPGSVPAAKPGAPSRQFRAARIVAATFLALSVFGTAAGTVEVFLHGLPFFVFRSAGTGGTPGTGTPEDQGPGQPGAPRGHHHTSPPHQQAKRRHRPAGNHPGGGTH